MYPTSSNIWVSDEDTATHYYQIKPKHSDFPCSCPDPTWDTTAQLLWIPRFLALNVSSTLFLRSNGQEFYKLSLLLEFVWSFSRDKDEAVALEEEEHRRCLSALITFFISSTFLCVLPLASLIFTFGSQCGTLLISLSFHFYYIYLFCVCHPTPPWEVRGQFLGKLVPAFLMWT